MRDGDELATGTGLDTLPTLDDPLRGGERGDRRLTSVDIPGDLLLGADGGSFADVGVLLAHRAVNDERPIGEVPDHVVGDAVDGDVAGEGERPVGRAGREEHPAGRRRADHDGCVGVLAAGDPSGRQLPERQEDASAGASLALLAQPRRVGSTFQRYPVSLVTDHRCGLAAGDPSGWKLDAVEGPQGGSRRWLGGHPTIRRRRRRSKA